MDAEVGDKTVDWTLSCIDILDFESTHPVHIIELYGQPSKDVLSYVCGNPLMEWDRIAVRCPYHT